MTRLLAEKKIKRFTPSIEFKIDISSFGKGIITAIGANNIGIPVELSVALGVISSCVDFKVGIRRFATKLPEGLKDFEYIRLLENNLNTIALNET